MTKSPIKRHSKSLKYLMLFETISCGYIYVYDTSMAIRILKYKLYSLFSAFSERLFLRIFRASHKLIYGLCRMYNKYGYSHKGAQ